MSLVGFKEKIVFGVTGFVVMGVLAIILPLPLSTIFYGGAFGFAMSIVKTIIEALSL